MAKFDVESFRDYFLNLVKDNLTAKLAEIQAEKGDGLDLTTFEDAQYVGDMNEKVMNFERYIYYALTIGDQETNGHQTSLDIEMSIEVVFANQEGGQEVENSLLRYTRAISEIILENSVGRASIGGIEVKRFFPVSGNNTITQTLVHVGSVEITGTIVA